MNKIWPQVSAKNNLPYLPLILRKSKDLGNKLKDVDCGKLNVVLSLEICCGKDDPNGKEFVNCSKRRQ